MSDKIKGESKILFRKNDETTNNLKKTQDIQELSADMALLHNAEAEHLETKNTTSKKNQIVKSKALVKAEKVKDAIVDTAQNLLSKKNNILSAMFSVAKGKSPLFDKIINTSNTWIEYIAKPNEVVGRSEVVQYTRSSAIFGVWIVIITVVVGLGWAAIAPLDQAAVARGMLVIENNRVMIKHLEGGVIDKVWIKDGQKVKKGDVLISLNKVQVEADRKISQTKYLSYLAENDRLISEREHFDHIKFSEELLRDVANPDVIRAMTVQEKLFDSFKENFKQEVNMSNENIAIHTETLKALKSQLESTDKQIALLREHLDKATKLLASGNYSRENMLNLESSMSRLESSKVEITTKIAATQEEINKVKSQIRGVEARHLLETESKLRENQDNLTHAKESVRSSTEKLARTEIKSPVDGIIHDMIKDAVGSVITQHQPIMEIVPAVQKLIVEAKVKADDIDVVRVGQVARVRLSAFKSRTMPIINGIVISLSPDIVFERPGVPTDTPVFYRARIELDAKTLENVKKLRHVELYPGMNAEVMIVLGTRTLFKYLLDPITQTFRVSLREQ